MKSLVSEIYISYATSLINEDRVEKRPWEGRDRFSEFKFEKRVL